MFTAASRPGQILVSGTTKGLKAYLWLLKILVPLSFLTMLLIWSGWLSCLDGVLGPVMGVLSLPALAVLPLLVGMISGIYTAMAIMTVLPLSEAQMTLIAIFLLISHNLVQEGIIQGKSGIHPFKVIAIRLAASIVTVMLVAPFVGGEAGVGELMADDTATTVSFWEALRSWSLDTLNLGLKLLMVILPVMIAVEAAKAYALAQKAQKGLAPLLKAQGLGPRSGLMWLVAILFGVAFGSAVIREESSAGYLSPLELEHLHASIGINHAVIEDPVVFLPLGLHPFWFWVPRFLAAVAAVYLLLAWHRLRGA